MDIPPFNAGQPQASPSLPTTGSPSNSADSIDDTLVAQLGLRHDSPIKTRVVSVQGPIAARPNEQTTWIALLEVDILMASLESSASSSARLQIISALPLQPGQMLTLMLDRDNHLRVVSENPHATIENASAQRHALTQILTQAQFESTPPLASLLQALAKYSLLTEHDLVYRILQNIPALQNPDSLKDTIENWIKNSAAYQKTPVTAREESRQKPDIDVLIKNFIKNILPLASISHRNFTDLDNLAQKTNRDLAIQQLIKYLKNVLTQQTDTSLKSNNTSLTQGQSLIADKNLLSLLMQSLVTRISTLHAQNYLANISNSDNALSFKLDIPLWIDDPLLKIQLGNVLLTIEKERDYENNSEKNKKSKALTRRWRIMMEFDLEESGKFEAEALVRESQVNISLWAEQENTQAIIQSKLQLFNERLIEKGIPVEGIHCRLDKPIRKQSYQDFSLINVQG